MVDLPCDNCGHPPRGKGCLSYNPHDPLVLELREAAKAAMEGAPCWSKRLRKALAAMDSK